jgi:hypothetical protein
MVMVGTAPYKRTHTVIARDEIGRLDCLASCSHRGPHCCGSQRTAPNGATSKAATPRPYRTSRRSPWVHRSRPVSD